MELDISTLAKQARTFDKKLEAAKKSVAPRDFDWYPYDTFGALPVLHSMLRDERRDLITLAGSGPVLDIGCGDGDLGFFFESLGCRVTAIDNPQTNFNRTRGFQALKAALNSSVELQLCDLDARFDLDERTFGLAFCFGLLYHLKNPFGFLETLANHARYCLLSTRIAARTAGGTILINEPLAYLVSPTETNGDATNFWVFSEAGLRRILERTGWEVCDYTTTGAQSGSDPAHPDRDQRAFCMLRSNQPGPSLEVDLDGGWHAMESGSWRWTKREFGVRLKRDVRQSELQFRFILPGVVFEALGPVRLTATVNGVRLWGQEFGSPGEHLYRHKLPTATTDALSIRFELDKALHAADGREIGVQVVFWSYEESEPRATFPIQLV